MGCAEYCSMALISGGVRPGLACSINATVPATTGAAIEVPTLDGKASIRVPPGTQPGTMFRLKGKGVKNLQGYGQGDLHVRVQV